MVKSLSKIAGENDLTRSALYKAFLKIGIISDIRTITEKGLANGVSYAQNSKGENWPVYGEKIQNWVAENSLKIKHKYEEQPETKNIDTDIKEAPLSENANEGEPLPLSRIAENLGLNRKLLLQFMIDEGYLINIGTETDKGREAGIVRKTGFRGTTYLVYDANLQQMIKKCSKGLSKAFAKNETPKEKLLSKNESLAYPYLGIDEFVIIDTETTGLNKDDEIVELSVVDMRGNELFHSYFRPEKEVNPFASKVNQLTKESLKNEPRFRDKWDEIVNAINGRRIMGHNISFDARLIKQTLDLQGCDAESVDKLFEGMIDTRVIAKRWIKAESYSLNNLTTLVGITREEQHNSTDDCRMTLEFINRLEDIIKVRAEYDFLVV